MWRQMTRSLRIFLLALSFVQDYRRIKRARKRFTGAQLEQMEARVYARSGARVRRAALHLQGLIIKVGQFLSARADVLPLAFTKELTQLQDAVPGAPFEKIVPTIELELGAKLESVFAHFEPTPIAAASLGQVHQATLMDGQAVAVKVQRPNIERLADIDLRALRKVVGALHRFTRVGKRMRVIEIYDEFRRNVYEELDYRTEAEHLKRFAKQFQDNRKLTFPRVHDRYISKRVLVMDFMEGVKITDIAGIRSLGVGPKAVVASFVDAYLAQLLVYGFVHLDPHPGNLLVQPDGKLCFLDFGMMGSLRKEEVSNFAKLVRAALLRDYETVVGCMDTLGFLQPYADRKFLARAIEVILDRITGVKLEKGPELDEFIEDFQSFLHDEPIIIQAKFMFIGRTIGMAAGVATQLHPSIDWLSVLEKQALPMLNDLLSSTDGQSRGWKKPVLDIVGRLFGEKAGVAADVILQQIEQTATASIRLPEQLERVLKQAEQGDLTIHMDLKEAILHLEHQEHTLVRSVWLLCMCISGVAGLWLRAKSPGIEPDVAFVFAGFFGLLTIVNLVRAVTSRRKAKRRLKRQLSRHRS